MTLAITSPEKSCSSSLVSSSVEVSSTSFASYNSIAENPTLVWVFSLNTSSSKVSLSWSLSLVSFSDVLSSILSGFVSSTLDSSCCSVLCWLFCSWFSKVWLSCSCVSTVWLLCSSMVWLFCSWFSSSWLSGVWLSSLWRFSTDSSFTFVSLASCTVSDCPEISPLSWFSTDSACSAGIFCANTPLADVSARTLFFAAFKILGWIPETLSRYAMFWTTSTWRSCIVLPSSNTTAIPAAGIFAERLIRASSVIWYPERANVPAKAHAAIFIPCLFMISSSKIWCIQIPKNLLQKNYNYFIPVPIFIIFIFWYRFIWISLYFNIIYSNFLFSIFLNFKLFLF